MVATIRRFRDGQLAAGFAVPNVSQYEGQKVVFRLNPL